jgi:hypothetical protein
MCAGLGGAMVSASTASSWLGGAVGSLAASFLGTPAAAATAAAATDTLAAAAAGAVVALQVVCEGAVLASLAVGELSFWHIDSGRRIVALPCPAACEELRDLAL